MKYAFLASFFSGILLGVRLLFFGAERRRMRPGAFVLRRSEPAVVSFLCAFGLAGYLLLRYSHFASLTVFVDSVVAGVAWAGVVTRLAIATARIAPSPGADDPRFALQGCIALVTSAINDDAEGEIVISEPGASRSIPARGISGGGIPAGEEVCIERVEDGIAFVERWSLVEERL